MYTGKINKLVRDKDFGFISARDGRDIFFHKGNLLNAKYGTLKTDQDVGFEVEKSSSATSAYTGLAALPCSGL